MENILLSKAILHILDSNHEAPILSKNELELEKDTSDFLEKHISKILNDGDLKKAVWGPGGNEVYDYCCHLKQGEPSLFKVSIELANRLFAVMKQNPSIPSADVIFCIFALDGVKYFSLIKLNYRSSYIHYVTNTPEGTSNSLIRQKTTLPGESQKIDECVIINLTTFELKIIEKKYDICGSKEFYLSKYFLNCDSDLSYSQKIKLLDKTVSKISKKYFDEDFEKVAVLRSCIAQSLEDSNEIKVESVAEQVFGEIPDIKRQYLEEVRKGGLAENKVSIPETNQTGKKFKTQKLQTDTGIEINFPSQFYNDKDVIEFINNPDGTISILIKNINKVVNK
ncbi:MAG: nucleoid-associated protein [Thermincola sp.]|nr:nucleoid-associated protein [Thermincola sp.]MDT3703858.1 nucleoid-associated protein [Thermincola sp.]